MSQISVPFYRSYTVRPTRLQALRSLITGRSFELTNKRVSPLIEFTSGTPSALVTIECVGGGGGGSSSEPGATGSPGGSEGCGCGGGGGVG